MGGERRGKEKGSDSRCAQKKTPGSLARARRAKRTFWVPSIPSVAWQPYPSPLGRLRAHSFASPPRDGFAFVEETVKDDRLFFSRRASDPRPVRLPGRLGDRRHTTTVGHDLDECKWVVAFFFFRHSFPRPREVRCLAVRRP